VRGLNLIIVHQQNTCEFDKLLQIFDAWANLTKVSFNYLLLLLDVWIKAFEELKQELANSHNKGESLENWQKLLQIWSSIFDQVFAQKFRSEDALRIQGKLINAVMICRLRQQQLINVFLQMNSQPTHNELDEIYRCLYELRKEIKSLKKALIQYQRSSILASKMTPS
jgi:polyhydroxyalkanoate synthase subunit PhaE